MHLKISLMSSFHLHLGLWLLGGRGGVNWCSGVSPTAESRGLLVGLLQIR